MRLMYDAVSPQNIPANAGAVAGYVDGRWPTYPRVVQLHPKAHHLSIATGYGGHAECLDVERFDASPVQAGPWAKREHARGVKVPCIYCEISAAAKVEEAMAKAGFKRSQWRLWTAHWTGVPHLCGPECGYPISKRADATQYASARYDTSLYSATFFAPPLVRRVMVPSWRWLRYGRI